jgi:hypothetical protein
MSRTLIKRKEKDGKNIEFHYKKDNDEATYKVTVEQIIKYINNKTFYFFTKDEDGSLVLVEVVSDYVKSPSNNGKSDNIDNLPKYQ